MIQIIIERSASLLGLKGASMIHLLKLVSMVLVSSFHTGSKGETVTVISSITEVTRMQFVVTGLQECYYKCENSPGSNVVFFHRSQIATGIYFR